MAAGVVVFRLALVFVVDRLLIIVKLYSIANSSAVPIYEVTPFSVFFFSFFFNALAIQANSESQPTESECRPHIEKALNTLKGDAKGNEFNKNRLDKSSANVFFHNKRPIFCFRQIHSEPDSEEIVVDLDDSNEKNSAEDLADAVVTEDDDNSEEVKSDVNDNTDDDSQEGINNCDKHRNFFSSLLFKLTLTEMAFENVSNRII